MHDFILLLPSYKFLIRYQLEVLFYININI